MLFLSLTTAAAAAPEESLINTPTGVLQVQPAAELGFLVPISHTYQSGSAGSEIDYITEGGQDNLFLNARFSVDVRWSERNAVTVLYQPLNLETQQVAARELMLDSTTFAAGTPMDFRYGFDFYRVSYTRDVLEDPDKALELGASLQIRNVTVNFNSADGTLRSANRDVGPVPILKTRGRFELERGHWWGFEVDGFYAPIKYLNGDGSDVLGAIADASLRVGTTLDRGVEPFLNVRYIGGGSEGTGDDPDPGKDGFTRNWLHLGTVTLGVLVR